MTAIRALGRLERRDVVASLLQHLRSSSPETRAEAAFAIAQAMRGEPLQVDAAGSQVEGTLTALLGSATAETDPAALAEIARSVARLPFERAEQVSRAEGLLRQILTLSNELSVLRKKPGDARTILAGGIAGAELLARLHAKLSPPSNDLVSLLRDHVRGRARAVPAGEAPPASLAFQALVAARGVDRETLVDALGAVDEHARRLAVVAFSGGASPIMNDERADYLRKAMSDRAFVVRYEAVRGYARTEARTAGCMPLLGMLNDPSLHVVLAAIDALGDACAGDDNAANRVLAEARTPPTQGSWHREAHALVALAKLSPERSTIPLASLSRHSTWQVRMYAARAAGILNDVPTLERLADDDHDNVREATLAALRRIKGNAAEPQFAAALGRKDYQLLRTAAIEMKGMSPSKSLAMALAEALRRVTLERKETSRDTRAALIERLRDFGDADHEDALLPLLRDFDPRIAAAAAGVLSAWTGARHAADPQPHPRQPLPTPAEIGILSERIAVLVMESGRDIELSLDPGIAPMTAVRFFRLADANYFDGLTFHRVAPNFVVQGGSPGANEYAGDGPYLRDEISRESHTRGTIGLSTRGHDTGDAQLFFNLVANPRLDFQYTIFGRVDAGSLARMDEIVEGDRIRNVRWITRRDRQPAR